MNILMRVPDNRKRWSICFTSTNPGVSGHSKGWSRGMRLLGCESQCTSYIVDVKGNQQVPGSIVATVVLSSPQGATLLGRQFHSYPKSFLFFS
jgi:hypothetical protein